MKKDVELVGELIENLKRIQGEGDRKKEEREKYGRSDFAVRAEGSEYRALRVLLDPGHIWGGLRKVHTPEGHYL